MFPNGPASPELACPASIIPDAHDAVDGEMCTVKRKAHVRYPATRKTTCVTGQGSVTDHWITTDEGIEPCEAVFVVSAGTLAAGCINGEGACFV